MVWWSRKVDQGDQKTRAVYYFMNIYILYDNDHAHSYTSTDHTYTHLAAPPKHAIRTVTALEIILVVRAVATYFVDLHIIIFWDFIFIIHSR